jgi:hypothetical protein
VGNYFPYIGKNKAAIQKIFSSGAEWDYEKVTLHPAFSQKCNHLFMHDFRPAGRKSPSTGYLHGIVLVLFWGYFLK